MPIAHISGPLYKGFFILILIFIAIEYFFGTITYTKTTFFFNNTTKPKEDLHSPVLKSLSLRNRTKSSRNVLKASLTEVPELYTSNLSSIINTSVEIDNSTSKSQLTTLLPLCPDIPPNLRGRIVVSKSPVPTVQELENRFNFLEPGGHSAPSNCRAENSVAIIIPFRCRGEHLLLFLQHMHPFLKRQLLDYTVFIIEQDGDGPFNRATLMNVGYVEALKIRHFDCFIFHDIDLLPEDDRNSYTCNKQQPRHLSVAVDIFKYRLPYREIFGGVSAITRDHFALLNGFSNSFWGWGGEDDDMSNRIKYHHLFIARYPINVARYTMLSHKKDRPSPNRYDVLKLGKERYDKDGLNSLKYKLVQLKRNLLYTWMLVGVEPPS